jgi:hypothetical protein
MPLHQQNISIVAEPAEAWPLQHPSTLGRYLIGSVSIGSKKGRERTSGGKLVAEVVSLCLVVFLFFDEGLMRSVESG